MKRLVVLAKRLRGQNEPRGVATDGEVVEHVGHLLTVAGGVGVTETSNAVGDRLSGLASIEIRERHRVVRRVDANGEQLRARASVGSVVANKVPKTVEVLGLLPVPSS